MAVTINPLLHSLLHCRIRTGWILPFFPLLAAFTLRAQHIEVTEEQCLECHGDLQESNTIHGPVSMGLCSVCHEFEPESEKMRLLKNDPELCLDCHEDPGGKGQRHGALEIYGCLGCHRPHGSDLFKLLSAAYPSSFYAGFDPEGYELCFQCHDASSFAEPETKTATEFRDKGRNLHFLHVNKPRKGRSCRACHEPHAGVYPHMIPSEVPFGSWKMPIRFEETENGGTCHSGCHQPKTYSRSP